MPLQHVLTGRSCRQGLGRPPVASASSGLLESSASPCLPFPHRRACRFLVGDGETEGEVGVWGMCKGGGRCGELMVIFGTAVLVFSSNALLSFVYSVQPTLIHIV
jgi:hypothetical protein